MHELAEFLVRPLASVLLTLARGMLWLGWDLCFQTVGWTAGWLVCRAVSAGSFPKQRLGELDDAPDEVALVVELIGLACLAFIVWLLSSYLGP